MENVQPDDADHHRGDGQRVTDHTHDAAHVDVIHQPAGEADEIQDADDTGIVDAQCNGGDQLCNDHKNTERTMPGQKPQGNKGNCKNDLEHRVAFAFLVPVPVNAIGKTAGKVDTHAGITAQQQIVDGRQKGIGDLTKYDPVVFFLLHAKYNEGCTHEADDLRQQLIIDSEHSNHLITDYIMFVNKWGNRLLLMLPLAGVLCFPLTMRTTVPCLEFGEGLGNSADGIRQETRCSCFSAKPKDTIPEYD